MRNRLVMKARRDRAEAITDRMFSVCERYRPAVQVAVLGPATKGGEMTLHLSLYAEHFSAIIAGTFAASICSSDCFRGPLSFEPFFRPEPGR